VTSDEIHYVDRGDVPDDDVLHDSRGRRIDDRYVDAAVKDALDHVRRRGRPSLSIAGESPLLRVRVSRDLDEAVTEAAAAAGTSRSEWVRRALEEATCKAG
jgi:predicted HicB family RNase H-like nuclease